MQGILELQGTSIVDAPRERGIYAWYFRPRVFWGQAESLIAKALSHLLDAPPELHTELRVRYGITWAADTELSILHGQRRVNAATMLSEALQQSSGFVRAFVQGMMVPAFAKPLYIGIADDLYKRVYGDHYNQLVEYWDEESAPSRYLSGNPDASVRQVIDELCLPHSFALEARVRGMAPRDLAVFAFPATLLLDQDEVLGQQHDPNSDAARIRLRELERVLQLLGDPIFGRS